MGVFLGEATGSARWTELTVRRLRREGSGTRGVLIDVVL